MKLDRTPKVSVIIPTFNRSKTVMRAVKSVLNQSYQNIEIIVIDDGSTDDTATILGLLNDKVQVHYQKNLGAGAARNAGIKYAQGEFIAFLDSDDEWYSDKLEIQMKRFSKEPDIDLISTGTIFVDQSGKIHRIQSVERSGYLFEKLLYTNEISTSSVVVKRKCLINNNLFFRTDLPCREDWDLWIRLSARCQFEIMPDILVRNHIQKNSRGSASPEFLGQQYRVIINDLMMDQYIGSYVKNNINHIEANVLFVVAYLHYVSGNTNKARSYLLKALLKSPTKLKLWSVLAILIIPNYLFEQIKIFLKRDYLLLKQAS